jgi:hypothetical protein
MSPSARGLLQLVYQWVYLGSTRIWHWQPLDGQRSFFEFFQLASKLLAVFIELLQRFITIDKVMIRGFMELHVRDTLMVQLGVLMLKYLSFVKLTVHDVLEVHLRCLQLVDLFLKICR